MLPATFIKTPTRCLAWQVAHCRRGFELARHQLASKVDELETRRSLELSESIAACLFALHSFHHQVPRSSVQLHDIHLA
jgi:hypothetical protein